MLGALLRRPFDFPRRALLKILNKRNLGDCRLIFTLAKRGSKLTSSSLGVRLEAWAGRVRVTEIPVTVLALIYLREEVRIRVGAVTGNSVTLSRLPSRIKFIRL